MVIKKLTITFLFFLFIFQPAFSQSQTEIIGEMINKQEYFKLRRTLEVAEVESVHPVVWHLARAFVGTYFNEPEEAVGSIGVLLNEYQNEMGAENMLAVLNLLTENYANMREYGTAAELCGKLAHQLSAYEEMHNSFRKAGELYAGLAKVPRQKIEIKETTVKFKRDGAGLITLPVNDCKNIKCNFVLDTGAGYSILPESRAADFGIRIVADSVLIVGGVHNAWAKMGVAESVTVGGIRAENVLFCVLPDSVLSMQYKGKMVYSFDGILGWDFIRGFDNLLLDNRKETLTFNSSKEQPVEKYNLMFASLHPYIEGLSGQDTLVFDLDIGANGSILTTHYFQKHWNRIESTTVSVRREGGLGGVSYGKVYTMPDFPLTVGQTAILPAIDVSIDKDPHYLNKLALAVDGVLGQDIIQLYDVMFLDFPTMSIHLKNKK